MRIGICFFMENNLGGAATQANDLVTAAQRLGHEACLLRFTSRTRGRDLWDYKNGLPKHSLLIGSAYRFWSERLLLTEDTLPKVLKFINTFDLLIFVGVCPHITRDFTEEEFNRLYLPLYQETKCYKTAFFTDPFWSTLYPYAAKVVGLMDRVDAFAEAYRQSILESRLCGEISICNFGSIMAADLAHKMKSRNTKRRFVWPHQWRGWKNPELMLRMAPLLRCPTNTYSEGIEYYNVRRDHWDVWDKAVRVDHFREKQKTPGAKVTHYGIVTQEKIMEAFSTCSWMLDLTGMSFRTGKPMKKFVGNYQCVNLECMFLGCVNFKYENTIAPYSQIPEDCVIKLPLITEPRKLAGFINRHLGSEEYNRVASRAKKWALSKFEPMRVFQSRFVKPFI